MGTTSIIYQNKLAGLSKALDVVRGVYPDMTTLQLKVLLQIASHGSATGSDLANGLDIHKAVVSRIIGVLSDVKVSGRQSAGLELVDINEDPMDRRSKRASLTPKGHEVIKGIIGALDS